MKACECSNDSTVVEFPRSRIQVHSDQPNVDPATLAQIGRAVNERLAKDGSREIEIFAEDQKALESEDHFKKRFGFALGRRGRIALFEVIDQYDLTSDEVRSLHRVGAIHWNGEHLDIGANKWIGFYGATTATVLFAVAGIPLAYALLTIPSGQPLKQFVLLSAFSGVVLLCSTIYRSMIRPFRLTASRRTPKANAKAQG